MQEFYPRPAKRSDGSYIYERIAPTVAATNAALAAAERFLGASSGGAGSTNASPSGAAGAQAPQLLYKKRAYEEKASSSGSNDQPQGNI